jgi:hypothetical protein
MKTERIIWTIVALAAGITAIKKPKPMCKVVFGSVAAYAAYKAYKAKA